MFETQRWLCIPLVLILGFSANWGQAEEKAPLDYNRDIRPILAANCYACHGPDAKTREARLRLDDQESLLKYKRRSRKALVPGKPEMSSIVHRITSDDPEERMPPEDSEKSLTKDEVEKLTRWIAEGASWSAHWAYEAPKAHPVPKVKKLKRVRNAIDAFILAKTELMGLKSVAEADREILIRRLTFDLLGLPPTAEEIKAFVNDKDPKAYEKLVDRLLKSPHFGERMAIYWLDLVRYADTRGYHSDNPRNVAPYRDYVIQSFNENKPYDVFTIEQIAGDLLPDATLTQKVATCYTKLNQTTEEGGAQAKEYEAKNASDRVRNISSVWMGATLGCAECHDHKYDPYTAKDFYSMAAFFADIQERAIMDRDPGIRVPTLEQKQSLVSLEASIAKAQQKVNEPSEDLIQQVNNAQKEWEKKVGQPKSASLGNWYGIGPFKAGNIQEAYKKKFPPEKEIKLKKSYGSLKWKERKDWVDGKVHTLSGDNAATYLYREIESPIEMTLPVSLGSDDGFQLWLNGTLVAANNVARGVAADQDKAVLKLNKGKNQLLMKVNNGAGGYGFYFKAQNSDGVPANIRAILKVARKDRQADQKKVLKEYYRSISPILEKPRSELQKLIQEKQNIEKSFPLCVVAKSGKPRDVRILPRGNWLDSTGEIVQPAIPEFLGKLEIKGERATRLDLANWIVDPKNPMTSRVFVNRLWMLVFGAGLSKRLDDLGAMGEAPSHPELLDWLALEFIEKKWNVKAMIKLMVTSSTYRQSSVPLAGHMEADPYNRFYARQSRWRLDAEMVRDQALAVSGLLNKKIGGQSVKPYQPSGYWVHLNFPKRRWVADQNENAYRRGLYTWWQRSFLHPSLMAFDAPNREECTAERPRSNIPQQALVLLNDPTYVEAAHMLAGRMMVEGGSGIEAKIQWAYQQVLSRSADKEEVAILSRLLKLHREDYKKNPEEAKKLTEVGMKRADKNLDRVELAAWTSISRTILNLHEVVTRN